MTPKSITLRFGLRYLPKRVPTRNFISGLLSEIPEGNTRQNREKSFGSVYFRGSPNGHFKGDFKPKNHFFREFDPMRFPKRSESVEIVFTDPDLGFLLATDEQKRPSPRLYMSKSGFFGLNRLENESKIDFFGIDFLSPKSARNLISGVFWRFWAPTAHQG